MKNTSFPDEPRQPNKSDSLGVKPFEDGIVNFSTEQVLHLLLLYRVNGEVVKHHL